MTDAVLLFSYGTLQLEKVQLSIFARLLKGWEDVLLGFRMTTVELTDASVIGLSGQTSFPIAAPSDDPADVVEGTAYEVTERELLAADAYEGSAYQRIEVVLASGQIAWIYIRSLAG
ncbi:gamma-glutamylcyclotransferase family protein [Rhizobium sp. No.120]